MFSSSTTSCHTGHTGSEDTMANETLSHKCQWTLRKICSKITASIPQLWLLCSYCKTCKVDILHLEI